MMSRSAGLHTDQASAKLDKEVQDLLAPQLTGDDNLARTIHAVNLEYACIAGSRFRSNFRSRPMMATKRKPPESGSQIQNLMSRIARPSMLALTSDDTP
jgi:hypothetical protein